MLTLYCYALFYLDSSPLHVFGCGFHMRWSYSFCYTRVEWCYRWCWFGWTTM